MSIDKKYSKLIDLFLELAGYQKKIFLAEPTLTKKIEVLPPNLQLCFTLISNREFDNMSDLGRAMGISNQQLTRVIDDLEKRGYVIRQRDLQNQRKVHPVLTEKGDQRHKEVRKIIREKIAKSFESLDELTLDDLIKSIENVTTILQKIHG